MYFTLCPVQKDTQEAERLVKPDIVTDVGRCFGNYLSELNAMTVDIDGLNSSRYLLTLEEMVLIYPEGFSHCYGHQTNVDDEHSLLGIYKRVGSYCQKQGETPYSNQ